MTPQDRIQQEAKKYAEKQKQFVSSEGLENIIDDFLAGSRFAGEVWEERVKELDEELEQLKMYVQEFTNELRRKHWGVLKNIDISNECKGAFLYISGISPENYLGH